MPHRPPHRHVPPSAITSFIDRARIDQLLAPWLPDAADREFVLRCILDEGPAHHRGANYVLLALLVRISDETGRQENAEAAASRSTSADPATEMTTVIQP